jgi:hypothetical protein
MSVTINGSGQVPVQVQSVVKTDTFSWSGTSPVDITGLSVTITPTSASNKILILCHIGVGGNFWNTGGTVINLVRGATNILLPTSNGYSVFFNAWSSSLANTYFHGTVIPLVYLDSPATTSATTYKLQVGNNSGADTGYINRTIQDQVNSRTTSTITVMEISG